MAENDDGKQADDGRQNEPVDLEAALARLAELEKQRGTLLNENKRLKQRHEGSQKVTEKMKVWLDLEAKHPDLSPEQIEQLLEQRSEAEVQKARETGNIDKLIANARKQAEKERDEALARAEREAALNQKMLIHDAVKREFAKYVEPEYLDAVFSWQIGKFSAMEDPENEYGRRPVVKVGDDYMEAPDWIKQFVETDDTARPFLKRSLAMGGGSAGPGGKIRTQLYRSEMTAAEKSRFIRTHPGGPQQGMVEYNKLPWSRDKKAS